MFGDSQTGLQLPAGDRSRQILGHLAQATYRFALPLLRGIATIAIQLFIISVIAFVVLRILPVDPLAMMLPPNASIEDAERMRQAFGFDRPIGQQFWIWFGHAVRGDLGTSIQSHVLVTKLIAIALPTTLELVALGLVFGIFGGFLLGFVTFAWRGTAVAHIGETVASLFQSIPEFLWGILFILAFGLWLAWLPFIGPIDPSMIVPTRTGFLFIDSALAGNWAAFASHFEHLLLPAAALGMLKAPLIMRLLRSSLVETYAEEYIDSARLRGIGETRILFFHALRNAVLPTITLIGVQAAHTFGGTLLIEAIFGLPGIGNLMITAIRAQDLPLIQGLLLVYCGLVLMLNRGVDLTYRWLNPRLRVG